MRRRSPKTGRYISNAAFRRWYAKGKPLHSKYRSAQRRRAKKQAAILAKGFIEKNSERIVKVISTRKSGKGGSHLTFLDIRVKPRRSTNVAEVINAIRTMAGGHKQSLLDVKWVGWKYNDPDNKAKPGTEKDIEAFAAMIESPERPLEVREE